MLILLAFFIVSIWPIWKMERFGTWCKQQSSILAGNQTCITVIKRHVDICAEHKQRAVAINKRKRV